MSINNTLLIIFIGLLTLSLVFYRKRFVFHTKYFPIYFCMCRTKLGIKLMQKIAERFPRLLHYSSFFIILIGFLGMILVSFDLIRTAIELILNPLNGISVGLVLPVEVKGAFYVPFIYWIICVFIIATIHEFMHGVFAKYYKIKVKATGFAFLGVIIPLIPAAFVEPDEKKLEKSKKIAQLSVFGAGPFINIILGLFLMLVYLFAIIPVNNNIYNYQGVEITDLFKEDTPAKQAGINIGEVINNIDNNEIKTVQDFSKSFDNKNPGDKINIITGRASYAITLAGTQKAVLGVFVQDKKEIKQEVLNKYGFLVNVFIWFKELIYWLFLLNLGVGLFNLVPIGPLDGGRMFHVVLQKYLPHKHVKKVWYSVSATFLIVILSSVIVGLIR